MEDKYFYRKIIDEIPLPVYVFQDGDLVYFNQAFVDYAGYDRNEIQNMNVMDLVHPEDRETFKCQTVSALSGKLEHLPKEPELRIVSKGGGTRWIRLTPRMISHNGQTAVLGVVTDITAYKN
ncbi:PAS domain S-box protein [Dehalogenimonas sp. 4OHTPN]|uniref:PAS domain S-box protein n=1 Tax=Dehalogenimonas sp. 4OHTPN TaxID=3166643 RepID=A0AAU8GBP8_9CHLR